MKALRPGQLVTERIEELEAEIERLRDLLAFNKIEPDAAPIKKFKCPSCGMESIAPGMCYGCQCR